MNYEIHPAADLFPAMNEIDLTALANDIADRGLLQSVVLFGGKILDGRNRYAACLQAKVTPTFVQAPEGCDPVDYVISTNVHRRNLTTKQRAAIAVDLANMPKGTRTDLGQNCPMFSLATAADMMGVSRRTVVSAAKLKKENPEAHAAIKAGIRPPPKPAVEDKPGRLAWRKIAASEGVKDIGSGQGADRVKAKLTEIDPGLEFANPSHADRIRAACKALVESKPEIVQADAVPGNLKALVAAEVEKVRSELSASYKLMVERLDTEYLRARDLVESYRAPFAESEYRELLSCLHPDHVKPEYAERASRIFGLVKKAEEKLKGPPPLGSEARPGDLPSTVADLMKQRRKPRSKAA